MKKKVFIGLSGGVDSSVSAALLKEAGYDVVGVFIKVWQPEGFPCTWKEDRLDAMRVAAGLDIPFVTLDLENEYKKGVIDYMFDEYKSGRTPNPDVMCNKTVKFGAFLKWALAQNADYIATGHYARVVKKEGVTYQLMKGVDENKDQSYFLWTLTQKQLKHTLFPIGEYTKTDVRKMAEKRGLYTAQKKDSQGLCFIGKLNMKDFLKSFIDEKPGDVLDKEGKVIGKHDGAVFFTNGQRHGFSTFKTSAGEEPYYVIDKDIEANTITVAHKLKEAFAGQVREVTLSDVNMIESISTKENIPVLVRVRYRQELQSAMLCLKENNIIFLKPQTVSIGQSAVIYSGDTVIGGGIIE